MSTILAIDTSTEACSVALLINDKITSDFVISQRDHTKQVLPMIDNLLKQSDCSLSQIDAIAFSKGPGSFTGVRIGIGVAQGLALGAELPMIGISTLETLAQGAYRKHRAKCVISAIDARMSEVYLGAYQYRENGRWEYLIPECVIKPSEVSHYLSHCDFHHQNTYFVGTGWQTYPDMVNDVIDSQHQLPEALDMLAIAQEKFAKGEIIAVENVEVTYLRNEVTWKKLPGKA